MVLITILSVLAAVGALQYEARHSALRGHIERTARLERAILRAALYHRGRITAVDVDNRNAGTLAQIEDQLRIMHAQGHCESEFTSDGRHVYCFGSFDDSALRAAAVQ